MGVRSRNVREVGYGDVACVPKQAHPRRQHRLVSITFLVVVSADVVVVFCMLYSGGIEETATQAKVQRRRC